MAVHNTATMKLYSLIKIYSVILFYVYSIWLVKNYLFPLSLISAATYSREKLTIPLRVDRGSTAK